MLTAGILATNPTKASLLRTGIVKVTGSFTTLIVYVFQNQGGLCNYQVWKEKTFRVFVWYAREAIYGRLLVVCGCLLVVCGRLLVVCSCLQVVCGRLQVVFCCLLVVCGLCLFSNYKHVLPLFIGPKLLFLLETCSIFWSSTEK